MAQFSTDDEYDCPPARLYATLTSSSYLEAKFAATGFRDVQVVAAGPALVETVRTAQVAVPGFAAKVLGGAQTIRQVERWTGTDAGAHAEFEAHAKGTPVKITGTVSIEPHPAGSMLRVRGDVQANLPLIGGKVAGLVASEASKNLAREYAFTRQYLAEHPD